MRHRHLLLGLAALLSACSQREGSGEREVSETPSVSPTAAPGVAFEYEYDFLLNDDRIGAAQERHAARCEALGVERCRITGLRYTVGHDDDVSATLEVRLAPAIA